MKSATKAAVALITLSLATGTAAAPKRHLKLGKSSADQTAINAATAGELSAATIATLQSLDPTLLAQPVAVIATHQRAGGVRVIVETPPRGSLTGSGRGIVLARGVYGSQSGSIETFPARVPGGAQPADVGLPDAAAAACTQLAKKRALSASFVLIVQPAIDHFDVIYSPIPYKESQTQIVAITSVGKPGRTSSSGVPQLPPVKPQQNTPETDPNAPANIHTEDNPN